VQHPSWSSLHTIFFDLDSPRRFTLAPEYLPVRDLSIMLDYAIWGTTYQGFHVTNLLLYLASIALFYTLLVEFGVDKTIAGIAALVFAVHPSHAESVAWITERKGLLGIAFALACGTAYARFRSGAGVRWLALAMVTAICAVWSKAPAAFAVGALAGLELVLPARRVSWRRSLAGLAAVGTVAALAFVPVVMLATSSSVVGSSGHAGRLEMVLGVHGFYLRLATMTVANALSYPIATHGPSGIDIALGVIGLVAIIATAALRRVPAELRAGAMLWLFGWLPASHLVLPLQMIVVADRYALIPTLGIALAVAVGCARISHVRLRAAVVAVIALAGALRTLDAQSNWASTEALWTRTVASNPDDGDAWSFYAEALDEAGDPALAATVVDEGLAHVDSRRLLLRKALLLVNSGHRAEAMPLFLRAAQAGEPKAMANLALLELADAEKPGASPSLLADALDWARRGAAAAPTSAHAHRTHGKVALAAQHPDEALAAFTSAYELEPQNLGNRFNLALALLALHRPGEAIPHLEACAADPELAARASAALDDARRQLR
jgi:hypothetical protein